MEPDDAWSGGRKVKHLFPSASERQPREGAGARLGDVLGRALREPGATAPHNIDATPDEATRRAELAALVVRYEGRPVRAWRDHDGEHVEHDLRGFERFGLRGLLFFDPATDKLAHDEFRRTHRAMMLALAHMWAREKGQPCDDERPCRYLRSFAKLARGDGYADAWSALEGLDDWPSARLRWSRIEPYFLDRLAGGDWGDAWTAERALAVGFQVRREVGRWNRELNDRRLEPARRKLRAPDWEIETVLLGMVANSPNDLLKRLADDDQRKEARALMAYWCAPPSAEVEAWEGPVQGLVELLRLGEIIAQGVDRNGVHGAIPAGKWASVRILKGDGDAAPYASVCHAQHDEHIYGWALPGGEQWTHLTFGARQTEVALGKRHFPAFREIAPGRGDASPNAINLPLAGDPAPLTTDESELRPKPGEGVKEFSPRLRRLLPDLRPNEFGRKAAELWEAAGNPRRQANTFRDARGDDDRRNSAK